MIQSKQYYFITKSLRYLPNDYLISNVHWIIYDPRTIETLHNWVFGFFIHSYKYYFLHTVQVQSSGPALHRTRTIKDNQETIIYVLSFWIVIYMFFLCSNQRSNKFTSWQSTHSQLTTPKWEKAYLFLPIFNSTVPWFFSVIGGHVMLPSVFFPLLFGGCLEKQNAHSRGCSSVSKCLSYFLFFPHGTQKYLLTDYDALIWGYRDFRSDHHISKPWKPNPKQQRK